MVQDALEVERAAPVIVGDHQRQRDVEGVTGRLVSKRAAGLNRAGIRSRQFSDGTSGAPRSLRPPFCHLRPVMTFRDFGDGEA